MRVHLCLKAISPGFLHVVVQGENGRERWERGTLKTGEGNGNGFGMIPPPEKWWLVGGGKNA